MLKEGAQLQRVRFTLVLCANKITFRGMLVKKYFSTGSVMYVWYMPSYGRKSLGQYSDIRLAFREIFRKILFPFFISTKNADCYCVLREYICLQGTLFSLVQFYSKNNKVIFCIRCFEYRNEERKQFKAFFLSSRSVYLDTVFSRFSQLGLREVKMEKYKSEKQQPV